MEATEPTDEQIVALEREVAKDERRLTALEVSLRMARSENIGSETTSRSDREALLASVPSRGNTTGSLRELRDGGSARHIFAFFLGTAAGAVVCLIVAFLLKTAGLF
jgi:hypothetical protein